MNERLVDFAIRNNVALCTAVCQTHGVDSIERDGLWLTLAPPPPYYSNLIVMAASVTGDDVADALAGIAGGGFKDSFARLDMAPHGFTTLFEAHWIHRPAASPVCEPSMRWRALSTESELAAWQALHGTADSLRPELLDLAEFAVLRGEDDRGGAAGAVINLSGSVAGLSNVFYTGPPLGSVWHDLAAVISERFADRDIVGYERGDDLAAAIEAGFHPIGPLRVWLRSS